VEGSRFSESVITHSDATSIRAAMDAARHVQQDWSQRSVRERTKIAIAVCHKLVEQADWLGEAITIPQRRDFRETLSGELMPLAAAAKWLGKRANRLLAPERPSFLDLPLWMGRLSSTIYHEPLGVVLLITTWNYPLLIPGVQMLQALVAGNSVVIKPAPQCELLMSRWCELLVACGVPRQLIVLLDSAVSSAKTAIDCGVDKVFITGSSTTGRKVLGTLSDRLTPATLELSGCDAMYILPSADLDRVLKSMVFGLAFNGSATCIAPRRAFVPHSMLEKVETALRKRVQDIGPVPLAKPVVEKLRMGLAEAVYMGARSIGPQPDLSLDDVAIQPIVLSNVSPKMLLAKSDVFAPLLMLIPVRDWSEALDADSYCPFALSASIFGNLSDAEPLASAVDAGMVTINDVIAPSADPRVPFGGRGESGFGVTRGRQGLMEMTRIKSVVIRRGNWLPHLMAPTEYDEIILKGIMQLFYANSFASRWNGLKSVITAAKLHREKTSKTKQGIGNPSPEVNQEAQSENKKS
jgi:acyl-CoA reductase-like NAD-dependent aldehyde dehydrogenase